MDTVAISKEEFTKILVDVETLIDDVKNALDQNVKKRITEIDKGEVEAKSEDEYYSYLEKRGVVIDRIHY